MTKKRRKHLVEEANRIAMAIKVDLNNCTNNEFTKVLGWLEGKKSQAKLYDIREQWALTQVLVQEFEGPKKLLVKKP